MSMGSTNQNDRVSQGETGSDNGPSRSSGLTARAQIGMDAIAIIGIGCRYPGNVNSPEAFWDLLKEGRDATVEIPSDRFNVDEYYDPDPNVPGKMYTRSGGFLQHPIDQFDPQFFGISPREAIGTDPQQRLLLEVSWEALEHAGQAPEQLRRSRTGVFMGMCWDDYALRIRAVSDIETMDMHTGFGSLRSVSIGRISYFFGFQGPSIQLDTACSSSLVAVDLACQSLRTDGCDLALAGGVNLIIDPLTMVGRCQSKAVSPDGRCKAFDAAADGYGQSEGCGVVVLKRLSDALADHDPILAVIRGSAVNHDGPSSGLTVPNEQAQESVIRQALKNANVQPEQIQYVEAHGTGTSLGDPIEIGALNAVFGPNHSQTNPLLIGSVKTNMGHSEGAAGVACLIKLVLALHHEAIPPHLHFKTPNPHIDWDHLPIRVTSDPIPWPRSEQPRLGGVSSFGISGTNAHVIVAEAPVNLPPSDTVERTHQVLTLSAKSKPALEQLAQSYHRYLPTHPGATLADICFTANTGRSHFAHRVGIVATSTAELAEALAAVGSGQPSGVITGNGGRNRPKIAFLFTGQGSQYVDMGRSLYDTQPTFKQAIDDCAAILDGYLEQPLLAVLYSQDEGNSVLEQTQYTQPVLFAVEYALYQLWRSWGIEPDAVMGHSVGEYVAACVAGVFSLADGLKLIAARGRLMQQLPDGGVMVSLMAAVDQVKDAIAQASGVAIAALNGPESTVISGAASAVNSVVAQLEAQGIKAKPLQVSHAFHSPLMAPMLAEFQQVAQQIEYHPPQLPLVSNVTGEIATEAVATAAYWCQHILAPVNFVASMKTLEQQGCSVFLECGPKPILLGMGSQCVSGDAGAWLPSLRPGQADWQQMLTSLVELYVRGVTVDWQGFDRDYPQRRKLSLPTYPFQRRRYWVEASPQSAKNGSGLVATDIMTLLNSGNTQALTGKVSEAEQFTFDQLLTINKALDILAQQHQQQLQSHGDSNDGSKGNIAQDYYNAVASLSSGFTQDQDVAYDGSFLTFGPFPEVLPDFSWIKIFSNPKSYPKYIDLILRVQQEMRSVLFSHVDFSACKWVLDFGCGYASDLIALAQQYPHLQLHGHTISDQQAQIGSEKVEAKQLQNQIEVFNRDSAQGDYRSNYDLVFGFEVAHHILDKHALFGKIGQHLNQDGYLVLADFISNADFTIEHYESSSFFITKAEWVDHFSRNGLQIVECIDISREISNFLYDANFDEHLAEIYRNDPDDNVQAGFMSYYQLGGLLRKGLASYILMTAKKQGQLSEAELRVYNQGQLKELVPYSLRSPQQWLYNLAWTPLPSLPSLPTAPSSGSWLIFADRQGIGEQLAQHLRQHGKRCVLVFWGDRPAQLNDDQWQIPMDQAAAYQQVCQSLTPNQPWQGVVHLWSLDSETVDHLTVSGLQTAQQLGCASVLQLVQTLSQDSDAASTSALWLITQGVQIVDDTADQAVQVQQAALWGLGRVIAAEHPELGCRLLDLGSDGNMIRTVTALAEEILHPGTEAQIALRHQQRYGARLKRVWSPPDADITKVTIQPTATYLITGGLGALGLKAAQYLLDQGAQNLVLLSRRQPSPATQQILDTMIQDHKATATVIQGDVGKDEDVARIFATIAASLPPLKGIIHAAGILDDGMLRQQNWHRFATVMAPKVVGSWNLHQHSQDLPLDFCVYFSSAASLLGSPGQGNYAAANAFMDGLAHCRRAQGLPGLSLNWGPWAEVGMAANLDQQQQGRITDLGVGEIPVKQGFEILWDWCGQHQMAQLGVIPIDWRKLLSALPGDSRFVADIVSDLSLSVQATTEDSAQASELLATLQQATDAIRSELLLDYLQQVFGEVLRFSPDDEIDPLLGFFDMGVDSLLAVELRNRLQNDLNLRLASTVLFKYSTLADLADYLAEQVAEGVGAIASSPAKIAPDAIGTTDPLGDEDDGIMQSALEAELAALQEVLGEG
ncbi:MAG: type I polyketide synthase [Leptolyngbyaceae bacterium]|nr:type I polyketide synthase [Leptolyngbyaceae bacterium]